MTVSVRSEPCELGWPNAIESCYGEEDLYEYSCSVTERWQDSGNEILFAEEASLFNPKTTMYIKNDKFTVDVNYTSYEKLVSAMFDQTDVLAEAANVLMAMGFEVKMPNPKDQDSADFREYHRKLPAGAQRRWNLLWYAQEREAQKECA